MMLDCGHEEYLEGHCARWGCPRYLNNCDRHCRDEESKDCSNPS